MPGTRAGGLRAKETLIRKYGEDFYKKNGHKGGSTPTTKPKGFAAHRDLAKTAGKKGGEAPRRKRT